MNSKKSRFRKLTHIALMAFTLVIVGCGSDKKDNNHVGQNPLNPYFGSNTLANIASQACAGGQRREILYNASASGQTYGSTVIDNSFAQGHIGGSLIYSFLGKNDQTGDIIKVDKMQTAYGPRYNITVNLCDQPQYGLDLTLRNITISSGHIVASEDGQCQLGVVSQAVLQLNLEAYNKPYNNQYYQVPSVPLQVGFYPHCDGFQQ